MMSPQPSHSRYSIGPWTVSLSVCALLASSTALAEPPDVWGTLLLSPDERQHLSWQRTDHQHQKPHQPAEAPLPAEFDRVSRHLGPGTLWHEGIAYRLPAQSQRQTAIDPRQLSAWPQTTELKPGVIRIRIRKPVSPP